MEGLVACPTGPNQFEHLGRFVKPFLFLTKIQVRMFKWADKTVVRTGKKIKQHLVQMGFKTLEIAGIGLNLESA